MGANFSCGGPPLPEEDANSNFLKEWEWFLQSRENVSVVVPLTVKWNHISANIWARRLMEHIKCDMEDKGLVSTYKYKVEGNKRTGICYVTCQVNYDQNDHQNFLLEVTYDV